MRVWAQSSHCSTCRPMAAENICDLQNWTRHKSRALRGRRARLALPDELIERARYLPDRLGGHLGVERRGVELGVSEQDLDHPDVDILFQKMRGEAVAQRMQRHWLLKLSHLRGGVAGAMKLACRERRPEHATRKQPALWLPHVPPVAQQFEQLRRQHHVAILAALALSLIHISEPTRLGMISYAVFCLKKNKK